MSDDQKVINFRGTDETAEIIERLMGELNISKRELLERMVSSFQTNMQMETTTEIPELKQLSYHLSRVQAIYVNQVEQSRDRTAQDAEKIKEAQEQTKEIRAQAHEVTENAKREVAEAQAQLKEAKEEAIQARQEAEKAKEGQEQSNRLAQLAERAAAAAEERAATLKTEADQANEYKRQRDEAVQQCNELQKELDGKINEFNIKTNQLKENIENIKKEHNREMDSLKQRLNLECQEQILQMRQELWEEYRTKLNNKDSQIQELYVKMSDFQDALSQARQEKAVLDEKLRIKEIKE